MQAQTTLFITCMLAFACHCVVFSQNAKALRKKKNGTPKRYEYKSEKTPSLSVANKVPKKKMVKKTGGRPPVNTYPDYPPRRKCRLCTETWFVPDPGLVLLDNTCSYWNDLDTPLDNCKDIQATYGSACGCRYAPRPACDVCPDGDYVWKEAPQYNTFTDDFCVRMIYRMSKRTEFCDGNKKRVADMCCSNTCSSDYSPYSEKASRSKVSKKYGKKKKREKKDGKSPKSSKSPSSKSKVYVEDPYPYPPDNPYYYPEGPDYYYPEGPDYYYPEGPDYYYPEGPDYYYPEGPDYYSPEGPDYYYYR